MIKKHQAKNLQNPDRDRRLATLKATSSPDLIDGGIRTNSVGNIVGTVSERSSTSSHDLHKGVEVLSAVVIVSNVSVNLIQVSSEHTLLLLHGDDILVNTREESLLEVPEENSTAEPPSIRLGTDEAARGLGLNTLLDVRSTLGGGLLVLGSGLLALVAGLVLSTLELITASAASTTKTIELLTGEVTLVEILDTTSSTLGLSGRRRATEKERTLEDVPPAKLPVVADDEAVEPRDKEDGDEKSPSGTDTNDHTSGLSVVEGDLDATTLPDDKHGKERGSDTEVDGSEEKTLPNRLASQHNTILGNKEDDSSESTRETRSNDPSKKDRNDTRANTLIELSPVNTISTNERNTHADNTTHDRVSRRDGKTDAGTEGEVQRGGDDGAHHAEHEKSRVGLELVNVDDLGADCVGDTGADTDGSSEFED
jgi:hypothetical protein